MSVCTAAPSTNNAANVDDVIQGERISLLQSSRKSMKDGDGVLQSKFRQKVFKIEVDGAKGVVLGIQEQWEMLVKTN